MTSRDRVPVRRLSRAADARAPVALRAHTEHDDRDLRHERGRLESPSAELVAIGELAQVLDPGALPSSLSRAAAVLRRAADADDAEIFLADRDTGQLVLAALDGDDLDVLVERVTFDAGEGHPGLAVSRRKLLYTRDLPHDRRYLRRSVAQRGIRAYASFPLYDSGGVLGSVHLAWRRTDLPIDAAASLLRGAARPLASTIRAAFALLGSAAHDCTGRDPASVERALRRALGNDDAKLVLRLSGEAPLAPRDRARWSCSGLDGSCPSLDERRVVLLGPSRGRRPPSCAPRHGGERERASCCLPVVADDRPRGVMVVDYEDGKLPDPPTRDVIPLGVFAREVSARLGTPRAVTVAPEPALRVRCFGTFEIARGGATIPATAFARRGALALLKILILREGKAISREALGEILWPEADPSSTPNRVHGLVHALRAAIEPDHDRRGPWRCVQNRGELYFLDLSEMDIDLLRFRRALASARRLRGAEEAMSAELERAVAEYRGDLFEDDPFEDWCAMERAELREQYLAALRELAASYVARGAHERAVDVLRAALKTDPLREDMHRALVEALLALERRSDALAQFETCVRVLRAELGLDPVPETLRLGRVLGASAARVAV